MISTRVRVIGEDVPECIGLESQTRVRDHTFPGSARTLRLHCGVSATLYRTLPEVCAGDEDISVGLTVRLPGDGEATADLLAGCGG